MADKRGGTGAATAALAFAACVLFSAGVVAPAVGGADGDLRRDAERQAVEIADAWRAMSEDCGARLASGVERPPFMLYGPGVLPEISAAEELSVFPWSGVLVRDALGLGDVWKGPYLPKAPIDPWGRAWVLLRTDDGGRTLVVSAAADGVVETPRDAQSVSPRDVGVIVVR
jgi:hypothetical protein